MVDSVSTATRSSSAATQAAQASTQALVAALSASQVQAQSLLSLLGLAVGGPDGGSPGSLIDLIA